MIVVQRAGLHCSIQDRGRFGYRHLGVPVSGVMDETSAGLANLLLDNDGHDALLEIGLLGPDLYFEADTWIALTGAPKELSLNSEPAKINAALTLKRGDKLSIKSGVRGVWSYLSVKGGFRTDEHLKSRSSYPPANLGLPYLKKNNRLPILSISTSQKLETHSKLNISQSRFDDQIVRVLPGPEFDYLSEDQKDKLFFKPFKIGNNSGRMAYFLEENTIAMHKRPDIITSIVAPGTIQLPSSGVPMALMKDAQSTGGYPRILHVVKEDLGKLAQRRAGEEVTLLRTKY